MWLISKGYFGVIVANSEIYTQDITWFMSDTNSNINSTYQASSINLVGLRFLRSLLDNPEHIDPPNSDRKRARKLEKSDIGPDKPAHAAPLVKKWGKEGKMNWI